MALDIALLGSGLLGGAIGERLLERGHRLTVWNRTPERAASLVDAGATAATGAAEAAARCPWLMTVLSDGAACRSVLIDAIGAGLRGRTVIQIGTIGVGESRALATEVEARGGAFLEAPVLGSRPEARAGQLQVMAGGNTELFARALPLLRDLDPEPRRMGERGAGLETKLALNQLIASLTHAFSLSLHLVEAAGVEVESFMAILRASALYAPTFDKKLPKLRSGDYANPNFPTAHLRKDLRLFMEAAEAHGLRTDGLAGLAQLLAEATAAGIDNLDYSALHRLTAAVTPSGAAQPVGKEGGG
ncbi:NAD(P)-dependent oxidoreductase [Synechococcus sp. CCY 9618]|uniref:NAD(P)-dependent oxidoreductase n=1 Tax=Synechococcus sp. CCY 9618 TaxID=2815602 RepID=UPI001C236227|nr:NAD(P)-dependent oxidoreductase [Synechococcus sp. CCY 9618]